MKSPLFVTTCMLVLLVIAGCGDDSDPAGPGTTENRSPVVSAPASVDAIVGVSTTFDVSASDPDGTIVALKVAVVHSFEEWRDGIRGGDASADLEAGEVTFTPNGSDVPSRILAVIAEDADGASTTVDVLVVVTGSSGP